MPWITTKAFKCSTPITLPLQVRRWGRPFFYSFRSCGRRKSYSTDVFSFENLSRWSFLHGIYFSRVLRGNALSKLCHSGNFNWSTEGSARDSSWLSTTPGERNTQGPMGRHLLLNLYSIPPSLYWVLVNHILCSLLLL